ncbi:MAG: hypothetical protein AAGG01_16925, partial [Planctomycetota bacterium]
ADFGDAQTRRLYHGIILHQDGRQDALANLHLPIEGPAEFRVLPQSGPGWLETSSIVLADHPAGLALSDEVFLDHGLGYHVEAGTLARPARTERALRDAISVDHESSVIDLGRVVMDPAPVLGKVWVGPNETLPSMEIIVSPRPLPAKLMPRFGMRIPGERTRFPSSGGSVTAYSFWPGTEWSVILMEVNGDVLDTEQVPRGDRIEFEYVPPVGGSIRLDLVTHPEAARVLVLPGATAGAGALSAQQYQRRLEQSLTSITVPLAQFRSPGDFLDIGPFELDPGPLLIEVWGPSAEDTWRRLNSHRVDLAAGVVDVTL